ncbi:MAG: SulP family inorganic anion transporter, partial [Hylemonella sp.]
MPPQSDQNQRLLFRPQLFEALRDYNQERLYKDFAAGLTVGVVALPLAMAFAIASGLKPEAGLITAIIGGFLIAALGGSRVQIGGPAGAFIVVVYGIVERYGLANLLVATALSGGMLFLMGVFRLGTLIRFIPIPVVIGFTNGIALLIILSQLKDLLGLRVSALPADFFGLMSTLGAHLGSLNPSALALSASTLGVLMVWHLSAPRLAPSLPFSGKISRLPGPVLALLFATLVSQALHLPVETIGSRFGGIPATLPSFQWPEFSWQNTRMLLVPAFTLAMLGAIESLLCARIADGLTGHRHDPNQELMAQGIANLTLPFFAGMPATGTIARTVTNIKSGATSPVAGMVHAVALLLIMLVAAPLASHVPMAALSAILVFVAWNMGEWREFANLRQFRLPYRITLLSVFVLTVVVDLTVAVQVGLLAACLTFLYRISSLSSTEPIAIASDLATAHDQKDLMAYRLHGTLFFGAVQLLEKIE